MALGFKAFDVYGELHLDRDSAKTSLRGLPGALGADADRAGREIGKKVTDGLARAVEQASGRIAKARRAEVEAAKAVTVAELRLNEARQKGNRPASQLLALENALEKAQYRLAESSKAASSAVTRHAEAQRRLNSSLAEMARKAGPDADRAGRDLGGKLSQGIHLSIVRHSPLIAAAIGAALAAGAPVALAGAGILFGGIGVAAAAQSDQVQRHWVGAWERIKASATSSANVLEPTLIGLADRVGDRFEQLQPRLGGVFRDTAPLVDIFSDSVLDAAENALPGLFRAVYRGQPVMEGFGDFLRDTGTGLSDFFDAMSTHSPAAGRAFDQLGDTMGTALPLLGEFLGQGVVLATNVLPLFNTALGATLAVTRTLGPLLPIVGTGLLTWKVAQAATGWIGGLTEKVGGLNKGAGLTSGIMDRVKGAMTPTNVAGAVLGATIGLLTAAMADSDEQTRKWTEALNEGGDAAVRARAEMAEQAAVIEQHTTGFRGFLNSMTGVSAGINIYADDVDKAKQAHREWWESMSPLEQAQAKVAEWSETLSDRLADETTSASDLEAAKRRLAHWQAESARLADQEARAIQGVTEAMAEQIDQARARVDQQFALENALEGVSDAQARYDELLASGEATAEELDDAMRDIVQSYRDAGEAAANYAESRLPAALTDQQKAVVGAREELRYYKELIESGVDLPPSMDAYIAQLERQVASADNATLAQAILAETVKELGYQVTSLPGEKEITIHAPTDELLAELDRLGITVTTLPGGDIKIDTNDADIQRRLFALGDTLTTLDAQNPTPTVDLNDLPLLGGVSNALSNLNNLHRQRPVPVTNLNNVPLIGGVSTALANLNNLHRQRPNPVAYATDRATPIIQSVLNRINALPASRTTTLTTIYREIRQTYLQNVPFFGRSGGEVGHLPRKVMRRSSGGPVFGEGGPTDDRVRMMTSAGDDLLVSPGEWIIKEMSSRGYGPVKMAAVNTGRADIVLPGDPRYRGGLRRADGGPASSRTSVTSASTSHAAIAIYGGVNVTFPATSSFDIRDRAEARRFVDWLEQELLRRGRAKS